MVRVVRMMHKHVVRHSSSLLVAASHAAPLISVLGPLLGGPLAKLTMCAREGPLCERPFHD
jgi:hypothetical protein